MRKQGFSSLYIVMILSSLIFFVLVVIEVTAGFATRSVAESVCVLTRESIASEYQKELWARYGIFALRSFDERLTCMAEFYINENLASERANILKMKLNSCSVSSEKYPALDIDGFSAQIKLVSFAMIAKDLISNAGFEDTLADVKEAAEVGESKKSSAEAELESLSENPNKDQDQQVEENEDEKQARRQARDLLKRYKSATENQSVSVAEAKSIEGIDVRTSLPSNLLGIQPRGSLLLSFIDFDPNIDAFAENEYIVRSCSYSTKMNENSYVSLEAEYILYGRFSDKENEEEIRSSLFWLRSALNIAHIYSNQQKKAEVTALAASAFSFVPLPIATFMISSIWAAVEAKNDVSLLFEGKCVPFFKTETDWKCSLLCAVNGDAATPTNAEGSSKIGTYSDYLRLFLLAIPRAEKLVRLMDIMQLNIANKEGQYFCFRDYAYGFSLTAHFEKVMHLPGNSFVSKRAGIVEQEYTYEK